MWSGYENGYRVPGKYSVHGSASACTCTCKLNRLLASEYVNYAGLRELSII